MTTGSDPESDLPSVLYNHLQGREGLEEIYRSYDSLRAAEKDLYSAFARARSGGWDDA
jgi:hypothetical protein